MDRKKVPLKMITKIFSTKFVYITQFLSVMPLKLRKSIKRYKFTRMTISRKVLGQLNSINIK